MDSQDRSMESLAVKLTEQGRDLQGIVAKLQEHGSALQKLKPPYGYQSRSLSKQLVLEYIEHGYSIKEYK